MRAASEKASAAGEPGEKAPRGAAGTSGVAAIFNNHFRGQAVANAIQLQHMPRSFHPIWKIIS